MKRTHDLPYVSYLFLFCSAWFFSVVHSFIHSFGRIRISKSLPDSLSYKNN